jgi:hypothetical protein
MSETAPTRNVPVPAPVISSRAESVAAPAVKVKRRVV